MPVQQDGLERVIQALGDDTFELAVQPIRHLSDNGFHAYEVLLRLVDGERRIPASAFMPLAERHRLATEVDRWVIGHTVALLATKGEGAAVHYVNVSSGGLAERQLMNFVEDQLATHQISTGKIGFEIREEDLMRHFNEALEFASAMKALGCHVALDGFTSGFSLMRSLENQGYDLVKISDKLLAGAESDRVACTLLDSANRLGHALGSETVAKCPNSESQLTLIRSLGFDYVQGDIVGKPQQAR